MDWKAHHVENAFKKEIIEYLVMYVLPWKAVNSIIGISTQYLLL